MLEAPGSSEESADDCAATPVAAAFGAVLEPVWNVRRGVVGSFLVEPQNEGACIAFETLTPQNAALLAVRTIDRASDALGRARLDGRHFAVHVPVGLAAIAEPGPRALLEARLNALAPCERALIFFEAAGCSHRAVTSWLAGMIALLRPHGRAVLARAGGGALPAQIWARAGLTGVAMRFDGGAPRTGDAMLKRLRAFAAGAAGYKTIAGHGLKTRGLALGAWAHGLTHVSGPAVSDGLADGLEPGWLSAERMFAAQAD